MSKDNEKQHLDDLRKYAWQYFQFHASQRLTTFNFYIVISTVILTGYLLSLKEEYALALGVSLGLLLSFLSFIFWKLDTRNKQMIKNAEEALKYIENKIDLKETGGLPHILKIFTYEEAQTNKHRADKSVWPWRDHYSFSKCFNMVFTTLGILGLLAALYAATRC